MSLFSSKSNIARSFATALLLVGAAVITRAQYQGYGYGLAQGAGYGHGGEAGQMMEADEGAEERPRVQLGIRLKIPAIRFELPRVNLPKVTISAKIRQPDGPRTINLPEINLDTSSRVVPPGAIGRTQIRSLGNRGGLHGGYAAAGSQQIDAYRPSHGASAERTQSFTFSTDEERSVSAGAYRGNTYNRPRSAYSSTNVHPSYLMAHQNSIRASPTTSTHHVDSKDPDADFDRPVYLQSEPRTHANNPISYYATGNPNRQAGTRANSVKLENHHKMMANRFF